jgi:hypothetical protein
MEIRTKIMNKRTGKYDDLDLIFDTGAYMTVIDSEVLSRAGYDVAGAKLASVNVVGVKEIPAREILIKGFSFVDIHDRKIPIGPVLVYAIDMSEGYIAGVIGLNIIREFETRIKFGHPTVIELIPDFDISKLVAYEDFLPTESRFGEWTGSQVVSY